MKQSLSSKRSNRNVTKALITLCVILAVVSSASAIYFYKEYKQLLTHPNAVKEREIEELVQQVSEVIELPDGEKPTLATVTDKEKLRDQEFFQNVENGDKMLIFPESKKAILYRPSVGKVIETATYDLGNSSEGIPSQGSSDSQEELIQVSIYNGTSVANFASETAQDIESFGNYDVVEIKDALGEYSETLIYDKTDNNVEQAESLAEILNGVITRRIEGETPPQGEVLIILGGS